MSDFIREIEAIAARYEIVPLRKLTSAVAVAGRRPRAALTFDDALACQAANAIPLLEARGLPYTLCIPTDSVNAGSPLWNTLLRLCILRTSAPSLSLGWISFDIASSRVDRVAVAREIQDLLLGMREPEWRRSIEALYRQCEDVFDACRASETLRPMTWDELRALTPALLEPASHSCFHKPAVQADAFETLVADARDSRSEIERRLGRACVTWCFPFGIYSESAIAAVRGAGYEMLLTSCAVPVDAMTAGLVGRFDGSAVGSLEPDQG